MFSVSPHLGIGGYSIQPWPGGGGGYPPGPDWGVPHPTLDSRSRQGGYPGYPPSQGWGTPPLLGQLEYSLHDGRYASCVHIGGLFCWLNILNFKWMY